MIRLASARRKLKRCLWKYSKYNGKIFIAEPAFAHTVGEVIPPKPMIITCPARHRLTLSRCHGFWIMAVGAGAVLLFLIFKESCRQIKQMRSIRQYKQIHMVGVKGVGMAALAEC